MKCTCRNERKDRAGKHNDRNFNLDNASHIDQSRVKDNKYYTYNGDTEHSFSEIELEFYRTHFSDVIDIQNEKNDAAYHSERNKTIEEYYHARNTRPEDKILQIGNVKEHASGEDLWECAMKYKDKFNQLYGDKCVILDMALHMDEKTPHVHIRRVWLAQDDEGRDIVSQGRALEQLGISAPDPSRPVSKNNNAKMAISETERVMFRDICIEHGLDIDKDPPVNRRHLETADYIRDKLELEINKLNEDIEEAKESLEEMDDSVNQMLQCLENNHLISIAYAAELEEARRQRGVARYKIIADIVKKEASDYARSNFSLDRSIAKAEAGEEVRKLKKFIERHGLTEEYEQSVRDKEHKHTAKDEYTKNTINETNKSFF